MVGLEGLEGLEWLEWLGDRLAGLEEERGSGEDEEVLGARLMLAS